MRICKAATLAWALLALLALGAVRNARLEASSFQAQSGGGGSGGGGGGCQ